MTLGFFLRVSPVSFVKRTAVDLEHGVVDFDYVRLEPVVIVSIHALNPERDMHRGCPQPLFTLDAGFSWTAG